MRMLFVALLLVSSSAFAQPAQDRFYVGASAGNLSFTGRHDALRFSDSSIGLDLYGGFRLRDDISIELSYRSFDAVDLHDVVGSGVARLDITSDWHTVTLSAVRQISLHDLFGWRRDWRLYGALGLYHSDIEQTFVTRATNVTEHANDNTAGVVVNTGVLYHLGRVDLRGYVSWFGVLDNYEANEAGVGVQFKF